MEMSQSAFADLPSDTIELILSFTQFKSISEVPTNSISEVYGRLQDGQVIVLFPNVELKTGDRSSGHIFCPTMWWRHVRHLRICSGFDDVILLSVLEEIIAKCPHIHLFGVSLSMVSTTDLSILDLLTQYNVKSLEIANCQSQGTILDVLNRFPRLHTLRLVYSTITDVDSFVNSMHCKELYLWDVCIPHQHTSSFFQRIHCSHLSVSLCRVDIDSLVLSFEGIELNQSIVRLRLLQPRRHLHIRHIRQINKNLNIRHLSIDVDKHMEIERMLDTIASNSNLHSVQFTNYGADAITLDLIRFLDMPKLCWVGLADSLIGVAKTHTLTVRREDTPTSILSPNEL